MKQTFNIRLNNKSLVPIEGKLLVPDYKGFKMFLHKGEHGQTYKWVVAEFYTGMCMTGGRTQKEAISAVITKLDKLSESQLDAFSHFRDNTAKRFGSANPDKGE